jgi:hypothetical protein
MQQKKKNVRIIYFPNFINNHDYKRKDGGKILGTLVLSNNCLPSAPPATAAQKIIRTIPKIDPNQINPK